MNKLENGQLLPRTISQINITFTRLSKNKNIIKYLKTSISINININTIKTLAIISIWNMNLKFQLLEKQLHLKSI